MNNFFYLDAMSSSSPMPPTSPPQLISNENMANNSSNVAKTTPIPPQEKAETKEKEKNHGTSTEKPSTKNGAKPGFDSFYN